MRYRRYYCMLDQLSNILDTGLYERISMLRRNPGFLRPQKRCKWQSSKTAREALEHSTAEIAHEVCNMSQTWTPGSRVSRRESRTTQRRKVRSTCSEIWTNSKGFITVAKPTERRLFFLGASLTFVALDPGEVLWDTGAQEGLVGKPQLDKWCKLLAEHGLQVEWSQEKPESASGIGGVTRPIGVVYVPVGLLDATVSFDSLLWSRMSHLDCRWG